MGCQRSAPEGLVRDPIGQRSELLQDHGSSASSGRDFLRRSTADTEVSKKVQFEGGKKAVFIEFKCFFLDRLLVSETVMKANNVYTTASSA